MVVKIFVQIVKSYLIPMFYREAVAVHRADHRRPRGFWLQNARQL
jgi:hypothetical protein